MHKQNYSDKSAWTWLKDSNSTGRPVRRSVMKGPTPPICASSDSAKKCFAPRLSPPARPMLSKLDILQSKTDEKIEKDFEREVLNLDHPSTIRSALEEIAKAEFAPLEEAAMLKKLKQQSGCNMGAIRAEYDAIKAKLAEEIVSSTTTANYSDLEIRAANKLADCKNLFDTFPMTMDLLDYVTTPERAQCMLLILGMMQISEVAYYCFYGDTSDGKTEAATNLLWLKDYESGTGRVVQRLETSNQWLKYAGGPDGTALTKKLVFFDEVNPVKPGQDDSKQSLLRQFDGREKYAKYEIVERDSRGRQGLRELVLKKPTQFMITSITAPHDWDLQNQNRYVFLEFGHIPESVVEVQHRIAEPWSTADQKTSIYRSWNYFLENLAGKLDEEDSEAFAEVHVPFLKGLIQSPSHQTGSDIRRFRLLKKSIIASALLHSRHREQYVDSKGRKHLVATVEDRDNVSELFALLVPTTAQPAGKAYLQTFSKIAWTLYSNEEPMSRYQLKDMCTLSKKAIEEHPKNLIEVNLLAASNRDGDRKTYYALSETFLESFNTAYAEAMGEDKRQVFESCVQKVISDIEAANLIDSLTPSKAPWKGRGVRKVDEQKDKPHPPITFLSVQKKKNSDGG